MNSTEWDDRYRSSDRLWSRGPNIFVEDRLATREPGVGLDLAAGEGRNAVWLAERGWTMTAVDFSEVAVSRGRSASSDVEFVVADVLAWQSDRSYDLVLVAYLHLVEGQLRSVVSKAKSWLSPAGEIFLIGHDKSNIDHGHGGPQVPEILWDLDEMLGWMEGLSIIEAEVVRRPVEVEGGLETALDTLIRARARQDRTEPV